MASRRFPWGNGSRFFCTPVKIFRLTVQFRRDTQSSLVREAHLLNVYRKTRPFNPFPTGRPVRSVLLTGKEGLTPASDLPSRVMGRERPVAPCGRPRDGNWRHIGLSLCSSSLSSGECRRPSLWFRRRTLYLLQRRKSRLKKTYRNFTVTDPFGGYGKFPPLVPEDAQRHFNYFGK